jgi:hypothetical protein
VPIQLNTGVSVKLSAAGAGTAYIGPSIPGLVWTVTQVSCFTSTNVTGTTQFQFYFPSVAPIYFQGGSFTGNQDTDTDISLTIYPGQQLIGVWSGGDSGATATMSILGTLTVNGV